MKAILFCIWMALVSAVGAQQPPSETTPEAMRNKGFKLTQSREGQCTLCHSIPNYKGVMGNLGPPLEGVGARLNEQQLRSRLQDSRKINPSSIMPPYFSTDGLNNVDPKFIGKTLLSATEFEEVIAYLKSLH